MPAILVLLSLALAPQGPPLPPAPIPLRLRYVESSAGLTPPALDGGYLEVEVGDVNGDGHPDLVSIGDHGSPGVNTTQHGVMVFFGDGTGGWQVVQRGDFGYGGCALGDVNGDGLLDVGYGMHHNYAGTDFGDQLLEVALGDGSGAAWTPWDDGLASNGETWGMSGVDFADVDGDGDLDLAANSFGCCAGLHVYRNLGNGTWLQSFGFLGGNSSQDLSFGEVDGDGVSDLCAARGDGTVWLGDGAGGFRLADGNLPYLPLNRRGPDLGDLDGDGRDELAFVNPAGGLEAWRLVGPGAWSPLPVAGLPATGSWQLLRIADMNGDGRADLVAFGNRDVDVLLNAGAAFYRAGGFRVPAPGDAVWLRAGHDLDHNGLADIVLVAEEGGFLSTRNHLRVFLANAVPDRPRITLREPGPGRVLRGGAVAFVDWSAAVPPGSGPATVDVELSLTGLAGPWFPVASGLPENGRLQWTVPAAASDRCRLRLTLHTAAGSASTVGLGRFRIR